MALTEFQRGLAEHPVKPAVLRHAQEHCEVCFHADSPVGRFPCCVADERWKASSPKSKVFSEIP